MRAQLPSMTSGRRRQIAFTLLEIMIAITIFSGVLAAIYSTWSAIIRGSKTALDAAADVQRMRIASQAVKQALASGEMYLENIHQFSFLTDTSGDFAALSLVSRLPASFPGSGMFPSQPVRRVTFTVEPGPLSPAQLVLRQSPVLEPPESTTEPYTIVLAPMVSHFKMFFWETNANEWVEEWTLTNQFPQLVRVELNCNPGGRPKPEDTSIQTITIASRAIPREIQMPTLRGRGGQQGRQPGQPGDPTNPQRQPGRLRVPGDGVQGGGLPGGLPGVGGRFPGQPPGLQQGRPNPNRGRQ